MKFKIQKLLLSINKAFRKEQVDRVSFDKFKIELNILFSKIDENESEEHLKYPLRDFLINTFYTNYEVNTKGRTDLVIYSGDNNKTPIGVIFEIKKPSNFTEMITTENANKKALHEAVLYYIRERKDEKNDQIKHIIITNVYEWFIFDAHDFEKVFYNSKLISEYNQWQQGQKISKNTDYFHKIVEHFIESHDENLQCAYFDIRKYQKMAIDNEKLLIPIFKILSATHLLKLSFSNDSNSLNNQFYNELLHIIGLEEIKKGGKKLIQRPKPENRNAGSLLENTIATIETENRFSKINTPSKFGADKSEQLFNVGLELSLTWINRILFLKLLEAQLIQFHQGDTEYKFLDKEIINDYDELNELFFDILAKEKSNRPAYIKKQLKSIPYLNSSLFEISSLEDSLIRVNSLKDRFKLPIFNQTVLKDKNSKKLKNELFTLEYLFKFLDAYSFSNEGADSIQEENKSLINASVLGLIFEKINGYKEGSFFTPGFITMYMSREAIRKAILRRFLEKKNWNCKSIEELNHKIDNRNEANEIINSLKICDPAVGSGHFLVSSLNEIIALKSELGILSYISGKPIRDYKAEVVNDELIITDKITEEIFEYQLNDKDNPVDYKQELQETIFHEKRTLIENCLFGVDLNSNSVNICRLRLWIELLKNTFYTKKSNYTELETLPNIDINIKQGNSLINRFGLNGNGLINGQAQKMQLATQKYKQQVVIYKSTNDKKTKQNAENEIINIKKQFANVVNPLDNDYKILKQKRARLGEMPMFFTQGDKEQWKKQTAELTKEVGELEIIYQNKQEKLYGSAFEWRFEFPEILDKNGNFIGFDIVIGNPPYGVDFSNDEKKYYRERYDEIHKRTPESFNYFIFRFSEILKKTNSVASLIIPYSFLYQYEFENTRKYLTDNYSINLVNLLGDSVFHDVSAPTCIIGFSNFNENNIKYSDISGENRKELDNLVGTNTIELLSTEFNENDSFTFIYRKNKDLVNKCYQNHSSLKDIAEDVATGVSSGLDKAYVYTLDEIKKLNIENDLLKKMLTGAEIKPYKASPTTNKSLIYITSEHKISNFPNIKKELKKYKNELLKRREAKNGSIEWYALNWPRRQKLFEKPKILIRQTASRIIAAYDKDKWYCLKSGIIVQLTNQKQINYEYLLALLNSKLMNFLYQDLTYETNRIFPEVKPKQLFKLPIAIPNQNTKKEITKKIKTIMQSEIISIKLLNEIDHLIYKTYNLTDEEINIVEINQ